MIVLGLTGSIGMGKSAAAGMFRAQGIPVFDADAEAHVVLEKSKVVARALRREFPSAFRKNELNRKKLGRIVFANPNKLRRLEGLVHPRVMTRLGRFLARERKRGTKLAVLDVPLLFETGLESVCDRVAVAAAAPALQRRRVLAREGMSVRTFENIQSRQLSDAEKLKRADFIIPTSASKAAAAKAVGNIIAALVKT
ncbi:MAG TPA: dephospho-CoA kinase [Sphingomonadales bacterium]|nr:dephospho-CoA kinase [Sphingomonadales bacterium]